MGGGGFLMEPENPLLDAFLFSLAGKKKPRVCLVPTASGDSASYLERFYAAAARHDIEATHLSLFKPPVGSLEDFVLSQDVIYVGGGNTRNLLVLWREWGLDLILRKAYERGIVLGGVSAGSICWFQEGLTDSISGQLTRWNCLGWLPGSNCPHYDGETERRPAYHREMAAGMLPGVACDDGVGAYYVDDELQEFVSSRPNALGYRVGLLDGQVQESAIQPRYLGA